MAVQLIGKLPFLPTYKDKYEYDPVSFYSGASSPFIYVARNMSQQSFDIRDGSIDKHLPHEESETFDFWPWAPIPSRKLQSVEMTRGEIVKDLRPERSESTLASGDLSCWFDKPRDLKPLFWKMSFEGKHVETFVSASKPVALECMKDICIMVERWNRGFDVYKIVQDGEEMILRCK